MTNAEDIEKMMGEFREAALVINHENRKQKANNGKGEDYKSSEKYGSGRKNKGDGIPKSLRMVDMESEKYQKEKKKKLENIPIEESNDEDLENRSCTRCIIF